MSPYWHVCDSEKEKQSCDFDASGRRARGAREAPDDADGAAPPCEKRHESPHLHEPFCENE